MSNHTTRETVSIPVANLLPNPFQPRLLFEDLESLAASIDADGLVHKIVGREHPNEVGSYQILDGERRFRAIQLLKWETVELEVGEFTDLQMATLALKSDTEHISFNVIETANGYRNLVNYFGKTQAEIAAEYNVSGPVVSNRLRLLALPESVLVLLSRNLLTETHGKTLCSIIDTPEDVQRLASACADEAWSSRRLEAEVAPVKERLDAAEAAKADGEQPRLLDEPPGEPVGKGEPLVSIFAPGDRIKWRSKMMPDVDIFGTVEEVTAKYLVVAPDGLDTDNPNRTIHLDFNVKKLPSLPKAEQVETNVEAASQSLDDISLLEMEVLKVIAADQDGDLASIAEESHIPQAKVASIVVELVSRGLIVSEGNTFAATEAGEALVLAAQPVERGTDPVELTSEAIRILKCFGLFGPKTLREIAEDTDISAATVAITVMDLVKLEFLGEEDSPERHVFFITETGEEHLKSLANKASTATTENPPATVTPEEGIEAINEASDELVEATAAAPTEPVKPSPQPSAPPKTSAPLSPNIEGGSMTATIPAHEADWLDEQDLTAATACALYRRFHQACEGAGVDPETMIAELEGRAASKTEEEAE